MAHRTASSILGAAEAPCKRDGEIIEFDTEVGAENYAKSLNDNKGTANVYYTVKARF